MLKLTVNTHTHMLYQEQSISIYKLKQKIQIMDTEYKITQNERSQEHMKSEVLTVLLMVN
jgi:hypothetical protein